MAKSKRFSKKVSTLWLISIFFMLLTPAVKAHAVRFLVTGDSWGTDNGVNTTILAEIARATVDEGVDFTLVIGDLTFGYAEDQAGFESKLTTWRNTMQPVYDAGIGVYPCRGNHDATGVNPSFDPTGVLSKAAWDNVFSGSYALPGNGPAGEENVTFSFTWGNVLVVGLDQYGSHFQRVNQTWLDAQFASNTQPHVFVFGHEPAFKIFHEDCLDDYPNERNAFWESITSVCGRTYFCGHDHFYNHTRIDDGDGNLANDIHQFDVATSGSSFYHWEGSYDGDNTPFSPRLIYHEEDTYGYLLGEVDGSEVTLTWKKRTAPGVYEAGSDIFTYAAACTPSTPPCPVKAIYGEHSEETKTLRTIRDEVLTTTGEGQELIRLYYQWSPFIITAMEEDKELKEQVREIIDSVLSLIRE
jgi:hypothetical protein